MTGLTNLNIRPAAGQAALLPNQPIFHGCVVDPSETATLVAGDVVTLKGNVSGLDAAIVVEKAEATDLPFGVVVGNPIKSGFVAKERISVFPVNACVYMKAASASIQRGQALFFGTDGVTATDPTVAADTTYGQVGIALTEPAAIGDMIVVYIQPGTKVVQAPST